MREREGESGRCGRGEEDDVSGRHKPLPQLLGRFAENPLNWIAANNRARGLHVNGWIAIRIFANRTLSSGPARSAAAGAAARGLSAAAVTRCPVPHPNEARPPHHPTQKASANGTERRRAVSACFA